MYDHDILIIYRLCITIICLHIYTNIIYPHKKDSVYQLRIRLVVLRKKQTDIEPLVIIYLTTYNKAQGDMRSLLGIQSECGVGGGDCGGQSWDSSEHEQGIKRLMEGHDELSHQVWPECDHRFVYKCTEADGLIGGLERTLMSVSKKINQAAGEGP